jgi:hypothetical protein
MRWRDRLIGILLGVILGLGTVTAFVFLFSGRTVDAPSISAGGGTGHRGPPPVALVRVIGGAPPPAGPAELDYGLGDVVRLRIVSDATVDVEVLGYGIARTVPADRPTLIRFKASKAGSFALIVEASRIDIARITVGSSSPP